MPMKTLWNCTDVGEQVECKIKFSINENIPSEASVHNTLARKLDGLNSKLPSGHITVDETQITVSAVQPKDVNRVKKLVEGKEGVASVKYEDGTAIWLDQVLFCHKELSKDGKPLSVQTANDPSPYDHLPALKPTIIVVHTEKLLEEWLSKIQSFLGIPRDEVGQIGAGRKDHCFISLSTIQTLSKKQINDAVKGKINLLISDEVHHSSAGEWRKAVCNLNVLEREQYSVKDKQGKWTTVTLPSKLLPIKDRPKTLGLSATPTPYGLERTEVLHECVGPSLVNIKDSDIIKQGYILPVKMIRESITPEESTKFISDFARLLAADFTAEISEKMTTAKQDIQETGEPKRYELNTYEKAFQSAIGGTQFTASAYDENKIKRAVQRIVASPDETFLVYSPRVIPLYAMTTLLRNLGVDQKVVPFVGKASQSIRQYKGVKKQIDELLEEIKAKETEIEKREAENKRTQEQQGYLPERDKKFVDNLKAQAHFLKEIAKIGVEGVARQAFDLNVDWITTAPRNKLQMPLDDFYKVRWTDDLKKEDLRPPAIVPYPLFIFTVWAPRREFKPRKFWDFVDPRNNSANPWEAEQRFSPAVASSIGRWRLLKLLNESVTEVKNMKVASSVLAHNIPKEEFDDRVIRENFAKGVTRVLPLSTAGQEGVDIPNANNLVVLSIFTQPKDPIQLTGRIKRIADGKKPGEALFLNIRNTSDDVNFRTLMKGLLLDVFETEHGEEFRAALKKELGEKMK